MSHFYLCVELDLQMGSWTNWWPQNRQDLHLEELCYQLLVLLVWELFCSATILGIEIFFDEIFTLSLHVPHNCHNEDPATHISSQFSNKILFLLLCLN